jgi:3-hydroxyacyl-CoA dehydrogenase
MSKVSFERRDQIAIIGLDNPPVNSLGHEVRLELVAALERANADAQVGAIVLTGSAFGFSGGADIREFGTPKSVAQPHLPAVIRAVEDSDKPVVAAVSGVCMGGGLELALACHYRVGKRGAQLALPEVKLGLLPGAGGTQRLPRLLGIEAALNMIVGGSTVAAEKLKDSPLFDAFTQDDLLADSLRFAQNLIDARRPHGRVRDRALIAPDAEAFLQFARTVVKSTAGPYPAPSACVEAVAAATKPFEEGLQVERKLFVSLMLSPESAALRHVFKAERAAARIRDVADDTPVRTIRKVGVVGAGTMGGGITMNFINAGLPVVLLEMKQEALDLGLANIRRNYQSALKKGKLTESDLEQRLALITPTLDYSPLADVDLVIEAVFESMDVKRQVFEKLDSLVKPGTILASNTSALNLDTIAAFTRRPQDVIGLHFFSPANIMRLLEVVRGKLTAAEVLATVMRLAKKIGKVAVISGVCDGFIGNRMLARYGAAAHDLVMAGASPQQVDGALQEFGMAMGPFRVSDLAGLDIGWALRKRRATEFPNKDFSSVADSLCEAGRFGQKTGAGWYRYEAGSRAPLPDPVVTELIEQYRRQKGVTPRKVSNSEITERCITALINEGARILAEGVAQRSSDIDVVYLNGYGFPAFRGGPMFYADQMGLQDVVRALRRIAATPGADTEVWTPAPLLARLARDGHSFGSLEGADS